MLLESNDRLMSCSGYMPQDRCDPLCAALLNTAQAVQWRNITWQAGALLHNLQTGGNFWETCAVLHLVFSTFNAVMAYSVATRG